MKKYSIAVVLMALALLAGCGHINNLDKYDLNGKSMFFEESVSSDVNDVRIVYPSSKKSDSSGYNIVEEVASMAGAMILTSATKNKLRNAANPRAIAGGVSRGIEKGLVRYLYARPVRRLDDATRFIVTTTLTECEIVSTAYGVYLKVYAETRITDRMSGEIVWENCEAERVALRRSPSLYSVTDDNTAGKVTQAAELLSLSESEIREVMVAAAEDIGASMSETFREDLIEARQK